MAKHGTVLRELQSIEEKNGLITPHLVVEEAKDEESPLHSHFEWDDITAGDAHRLWQARALIKNVTLKIDKKRHQAFFNVQVNQEENTKGYVSRVKVLDSDDYKQQILRDALRRIQYWQDQYQEVKELTGIVNKKRVVEVKTQLK